MFIDLSLMLVTVLLGIVYTIFSTITAAFGFVFPPEIQAAWTTAFSYLGVMQGIFPVDTAVTAITFLLTVVGIAYFVKLIIYFVNKLRGITQPGSSDMPG